MRTTHWRLVSLSPSAVAYLPFLFPTTQKPTSPWALASDPGDSGASIPNLAYRPRFGNLGLG